MRFLSVILAAMLLLSFAAKAETTNGLSEAEIKGRDLARQLCDARPAENFTNTGVLQIRDGSGKRTNTPVKCKVVMAAVNWQSIYESTQTNASGNYSPHLVQNMLLITHAENEPNRYEYENSNGPMIASPSKIEPTSGDAAMENQMHIVSTISKLTVDELMRPFANSDFWLCDLGLEFLHWPAQKILPKTTNLKRGREYTLLESTNPNPPTNGYSRVLSWIDKESGGILEAEAYDAQGKLLKVFEPKSFKKVNGQWELQEMEIRNVQTGSRTRLEFDLKKD